MAAPLSPPADAAPAAAPAPPRAVAILPLLLRALWAWLKALLGGRPGAPGGQAAR